MLMLFKDVSLRTRRALLLYKVYMAIAPFWCLKGTSLNSVNALLALSQCYVVLNRVMFFQTHQLNLYELISHLMISSSQTHRYRVEEAQNWRAVQASPHDAPSRRANRRWKAAATHQDPRADHGHGVRQCRSARDRQGACGKGSEQKISVEENGQLRPETDRGDWRP